MNGPPHRDQTLLLALDLLHDPPQITSVDAGGPIEFDPVTTSQDDLRFATLSVNVGFSRCVAAEELGLMRPEPTLRLPRRQGM
jgi:hypothetical protein